MGTLLVSQRSWSVHLARGRPGGRSHAGSGGRPTDNSTWRSMAWCGGVLSGNLATCPNMALRPLVIRSDAGARPVRKETSELRTKSCHLIPSSTAANPLQQACRQQEISIDCSPASSSGGWRMQAVPRRCQRAQEVEIVRSSLLFLNFSLPLTFQLQCYRIDCSSA